MGGQSTDCFRSAHPLSELVLPSCEELRALEGDAKMKYFQHAGALLTADGSDDQLIQFEGSPVGYEIQI